MYSLAANQEFLAHSKMMEMKIGDADALAGSSVDESGLDYFPTPYTAQPLPFISQINTYNLTQIHYCCYSVAG